MSGGEDKSEAPTPQRKKKAREEGNIPKTPELTAWAQVLLAAVLLATVGATAARQVRGLFDQTGLVLAAEPDPAAALRLLGEGLKTCMLVLLPISAAMAAVGVAGQLAQVGNAATLKMLKPKFDKLNLFKGLKRLVSPHSLWEAGKTLIKLVILGELTRRAITQAMPKLLEPGIPVDSMVALVVEIVMRYVRDVAMAGLLLAVLDYAMIRRKVNKGLKMSRQEIKEESKSAEGNPETKGAIRSKQMAMSRMRMMAEVAGSDVIVTNPTHIAVALKYDPIKGAPRVVAKGSGAVAERIKAEATAHRVPVIRDVPLARTLHRVCELGDEIPAELFEAVARVLAFVFGLKRRGAAAGEHSAQSGLSAELELPRQRRRRRAG
jgi:flagellar biosynthesis protein FlhB